MEPQQQSKITEEFKAVVKEIGDPVTPEQIGIYQKLTEISDNSYRLRTIVNAWEKQHTEERKMRKGFATAILIALFFQIIVINTAFFFIGFKLIQVEQWVASTFIIGVFTEVISMTMLVLRYLFPKLGSEIIELIKKL